MDLNCMDWYGYQFAWHELNWVWFHWKPFRFTGLQVLILLTTHVSQWVTGDRQEFIYRYMIITITYRKS